MSVATIASIVETFSSRLCTLESLLLTGAGHFQQADEAYLGRRLVDDMHPLGAQIAFTCNQPRNFALWSKGAAASDLDPNVDSLATGLRYVQETRSLLTTVVAPDAMLSDSTRLQLGHGLVADLTGHQYVNDFLVPNFYFHLVTTYAILRMSGVQIGKRDYMLHLVPHVRLETA